MLTIQLEERPYNKWNISINNTNADAAYMDSEEFKKIANLIGSACNQINELRKDPGSEPELRTENL